ncbi:COP23 domain-containing protein [Trichothermofontia sp.]
MTLPRSIRALLSATLVSGAMAATSLPGLAQTNASTASRFFCGLYRGHPATIARTVSRGNIPLILWVDDSFPEPWNPQSRCEEISARFQRFYENGTLNHLRAAVTNGQPALCVAAYHGGDCLPNGLVVTLRPYTDPSAVLDRLLTKRVMVDGQPIFLSGMPEADRVPLEITPVGEAVYGDLRPLLELLPPVPQASIPLPPGPIWEEPSVGHE